jgi:hypothetical protein
MAGCHIFGAIDAIPIPVCTKNSDSDVVVMQFTEESL